MELLRKFKAVEAEETENESNSEDLAHCTSQEGILKKVGFSVLVLYENRTFKCKAMR